MVTRNKERLFGKIQGEGVVLNEWGKIALRQWHLIPKHFPQVDLDAFIVMPNHVHGILLINELKTAEDTSYGNPDNLLVGATHAAQNTKRQIDFSLATEIPLDTYHV